MIPYFMLLVVPLIISMALQAVFNHGRVSLFDNKTADKNPMLIVFFIYLAGVLMFRGKTVGLDLPNYNYMFNKCTGSSLAYILKNESDIFYKVLNWIIGKFTHSFQWVMIASAILTLIPFFLLYSEDKRNSYLKIVLFINTAVFMILFSALRQSIAIGVGVCAYYLVRKHKLAWFLLLVLVANLFHHSAFILILMYPIYHMRLNSKHLWLIIPFVLAFIVFREQIFLFTTNIMTNFYDKYDSEVTSTGAASTFLLYIMFSIYSYVIPDEKKMSEELIGLRNFVVLTAVLQSFASLNSLAMRINYYYIIFIPIAICKFVEIPKKPYARIAFISKCVMCVFFTLYFAKSIIDANNTNDLLGIVPYESMWRWFN